MVQFEFIEMINIAIVFCLFITIVWDRDVKTLLLSLLLYGTFHFSYSLIALTSEDYTNEWSKMHFDGGGILAMSSAFLLLTSVYLLLIKPAFDQFVTCQRNERAGVYLMIFALFVIPCGYVLNIRIADWIQLKDTVSIMAIFLLLILASLGLNRSNLRTLKEKDINLLGLAGLLLFLFIDGVAIYEVISHRSWAGTFQSSGEMVYRASSTLFNPNLFGLWASLVYLGCAYGMYKFQNHRKILICGMILASIAIYFSGSRSTGYILLATLCLSSLLIRHRLRFLPVLILLLSMFSVYMLTLKLVVPFVTNKEGWYAVIFLGERFANTPLELVNYVLTYMGIGGGYVAFDVPIEIKQSIEGRFVGKQRDAGWISFYHDVGWTGVSAVIFVIVVALLQGVHKYYKSHCIESVFALTTLCYSLLIGMVMRYQVFPIWLFIGIALAPCVAFWLRSGSSLRKSIND